MANTSVLSTVIDSQVKKAATSFCKAQGIKLRYFIEQSLIESLEDHIDLQAYRSRKEEETISLEELLNAKTSKK